MACLIAFTTTCTVTGATLASITQGQAFPLVFAVALAVGVFAGITVARLHLI